MKKLMVILGVLTGIFCSQVEAALDKKTYPHWDWDSPADIAKLAEIDAFIEANKHYSPIAVFDWDGTVYDETIRTRERVGGNVIKSGQAVWHIWAANNASQREYAALNLFPQYRDCSGACILTGLINKDDYLEGLAPGQHPIDNYSKFSQIAVIEAGMTPDAFIRGVNAYEKRYPVKHYAFLPMFDVIQNMLNNQFKVWFISGSNPYFIATLLKKVEQLDPRYNFASITGKALLAVAGKHASSSRIIGNQAKLYRGKFTRIYDDRYVLRLGSEPLHAIVGEGKALAMRRFISKQDNGQIIFAAGNSGGDIEMMAEVLKTPNSMLLAVNPAQKLREFLAEQQTAQIITLDIPEEQE